MSPPPPANNTRRGITAFVFAALAVAGVVAAPAAQQGISQSAYEQHKINGEWLADDSLQSTTSQRLALNRPLRDQALRFSQQGSDYFNSLLAQEIGLHAFQNLLRDKLLARNNGNGDFNPLANIQADLARTAQYLPILTADTLTDYLTTRGETQARALRFVREVDIEFRSEVGGRKAYGGVSALGALQERANDVVAWQLRGYGATGATAGGNAGVIYRFASGRGSGLNTLFGANVFLDFENTEHGSFSRLSFGGEIRSSWLDMFANHYRPITDPKVLNERETAYTQGGYDLALHLHTPRLPWLRGGLTYYSFDGEAQDEDEKGTRFHVAADVSNTALGIDGLRVYAEYDAGKDSNERDTDSLGIGFSYRYYPDAAARGRAPNRAAAAEFDPRDHFFAPVHRETTQRVVVSTLDVEAEARASLVRGAATYTHGSDSGNITEEGIPFPVANTVGIITDPSQQMNTEVAFARRGVFDISLYYDTEITYRGAARQVHLARGQLYYRTDGNRQIEEIHVGANNITIALIGTELSVVARRADPTSVVIYPTEGEIHIRPAAAAHIANNRLSIVLDADSNAAAMVRITDPTSGEQMTINTREGLRLAGGSPGASGRLYALANGTANQPIATLQIGGGFSNDSISWSIHNNPGGYGITPARVLTVPAVFSDGDIITVSMRGPHGLHGAHAITLMQILPLDFATPPPAALNVFDDVAEAILTVQLQGGQSQYRAEISDAEHGNAANFRFEPRANGEFVFYSQAVTHNSGDRLILNFTDSGAANISLSTQAVINLNITPRIAMDDQSFNARVNNTDIFGTLQSRHGKGSHTFSTTSNRVIITPSSGEIRMATAATVTTQFSIPAVVADEAGNTATANINILLSDRLVLDGSLLATYHIPTGSDTIPFAQITIIGGDGAYDYNIASACYGSRFTTSPNGSDTASLEASGSRSGAGSTCELQLVITDPNNPANLDPLTLTLTLQLFDQLALTAPLPGLNAYTDHASAIVTLQVQGGVGNIALTPPSLPQGFSLLNSSSDNTYTLSVISQPPAAFGNQSQINIPLTFTSDANNLTNTAESLQINLPITINAPLQVAGNHTAHIPLSQAANAGFFTLPVSGGVGNYTYSLSSDANLVISNSGAVSFSGSGGPASSGTVLATIVVADNNGSGASLTATLTLLVFNQLSESGARPVINAFEGYGEDILTLQIAGGTGNYTASHDPLPTGFSFGSSSTNGAFTLSVANQTAAEYGNADTINLQITIESDANTDPARSPYANNLVLDLQVNVNPAFAFADDLETNHTIEIAFPLGANIYTVPTTGGKGNPFFELNTGYGSTGDLAIYSSSGIVAFLGAVGPSSAQQIEATIMVTDSNGSGNTISTTLTIDVVAPNLELTNLHDVDSNGAANIPFAADNDTVVAQLSTSHTPSYLGTPTFTQEGHADKFEIIQNSETNTYELLAKLHEAPPQAAETTFTLTLTLAVGSNTATEQITINLPEDATGAANVPTQGDIILLDHAGHFEIKSGRRGSTLTVQHHQKMYKSSDGVNWTTIFDWKDLTVAAYFGNDTYGIAPGAALYVTSEGNDHHLHLLGGSRENFSPDYQNHHIRSTDGGSTWSVVSSGSANGVGDGYQEGEQHRYITHTRSDGSVETVKLGGRFMFHQTGSGNNAWLFEGDQPRGNRLTNPTNTRFTSNSNWEQSSNAASRGGQPLDGTVAYGNLDGKDLIHALRRWMPINAASFRGGLYHTPQNGGSDGGSSAGLRRCSDTSGAANGNAARGDCWESVSGSAKRDLRGAGLVVFNGFLWALGGREDADAMQYSVDGDNWIEVVYGTNAAFSTTFNAAGDELTITVPANPNRFANGGRDWCNPILLVHGDYLYILGGGECTTGNDVDAPTNRIMRSKDGLNWELLDTRSEVGGTLSGYESIHLGHAAVLPN